MGTKLDSSQKVYAISFPDSFGNSGLFDISEHLYYNVYKARSSTQATVPVEVRPPFDTVGWRWNGTDPRKKE